MSDYAANFSQTKKIVNLPGSGFFFFNGGKKKKIRNSGKIRRWPIPVVPFTLDLFDFDVQVVSYGCRPSCNKQHPVSRLGSPSLW